MQKFTQLKKIIDEHDSFLLTTHVNPDADALGSELAMHLILKSLGKKVRSINHSATPYNLEFLDEEKVVEKFDEQIHSEIFNETEVVIVVDLNQANRVVKMEKGLRSFTGIKICIDHHQDPENFVDYFFGGAEYSATGEIIFDFIKETGIVKIDKHLAELLYTAIMTDTGSFRFERTSPKVHKIIAELLEAGVNPTFIADKVYDQFRFSRIKLLGRALTSVETRADGKIAYMIISQIDMEQCGASDADVEGFVNHCLSIQNVEIGILFYELKDGIKISFRSKGEIAVNKLAGAFGGGGHLNAAGTRLFNVPLNEIKEKVLHSALKYVDGESV